MLFYSVLISVTYPMKLFKTKLRFPYKPFTYSAHLVRHKVSQAASILFIVKRP